MLRSPFCGAGCPTAPPAGKPQLRLVPFATHTGLAARVEGWLNAVRARVRYGALCPAQQSDVCTLLDEMRLIKDAHELDIMRRASQISAQAHIRAMQRSARMLRAGQDVREYHLDAELLHAFREGGSQYPAYGSIVAAGANACVLHYRADAAPVRDGELVLIDAGCELDGYASDITRTFPANGKFTARSARCTTWCWPARTPPSQPPRPVRASTTRTTPRWPCWRESLLDLGLLDKNKVGTAQDVIDKTCLLPVLHAPHRPLAGHGCARLRQLRGARRGGPGQRTQGSRSRARPSPTAPAACCAPAWC